MTVSPSRFDPERLVRLEDYLQQQVDSGRIPGVSALIAHRGEQVYHRTLGYADLQRACPLDQDAIFRVFSLSKVVTSVAVLMLYERGYFLLRDPVAAYMPELGELKVYRRGFAAGDSVQQEIKIIDLLKHTGGLGYGNDKNHPVDRMYREAGIFDYSENLTEFVSKLAKLPLKYQPGTRWEYSVSHDVLGRLVEVVSGRRLDEFLRVELFEPLGMSDTGFRVPHNKKTRFLPLYERSAEGGVSEENAEEAMPYSEKLALFAGGQGLISTLPDFYRFLLMLRNGGEYQGRRYLSRKTVGLMTRNHLPANLLGDLWMSGYGYGLGVGVLVDLSRHQNLGSEGEYTWSGSGCTYFWIDPAEDIIALLFTQVVPQSRCFFPLQFKSLMYQALE